MIRWGTFLLFFFSLSVAAKESNCRDELTFQVSKNAYADQRRHEMPKVLMDAVIEDGYQALLENFECSPEYVIVFRPYWPTIQRENAGYLVSFSQDKHNRLWLERIEPAEIREQRDYFEKLARCEGLAPIYMMLKEPLLNQHSIEIPPGVQLKLRAKHELDVREVKEALTNRLGDPVYVKSNRKQLNDRYQFRGLTKAGRELKVVVDVNPADQSVSLVSAY